MNNGLEDLTVTRLLIDASNSKNLFAGTYGSGVYMSRDQGKTWEAANNGLVDAFVYSMTSYPRPGKGGLLKRLTSGQEGNSGLLVGVYGGKLYSATASTKPEWQPLGADTQKM